MKNQGHDCERLLLRFRFALVITVAHNYIRTLRKAGTVAVEILTHLLICFLGLGVEVEISEGLFAARSFNPQRAAGSIQRDSDFVDGLLKYHTQLKRLANRRRNPIDRDFAA